MTTPNQSAPDIQSLVGMGAFEVGNASQNWGQQVTETFVRVLIQGPAAALGQAFTDLPHFLTELAKYLATLPLEALKMFQGFIPGATAAMFNTVSSAVTTILNALSVSNLRMLLSDFQHWLETVYDILATEMHQILDAILGMVITPITGRVAGFLDWLASLAGFQTDTQSTINQFADNFTDLIFGVGGTVFHDVVDAVSAGLNAALDIQTLLTAASAPTVAALGGFIHDVIEALNTLIDSIASAFGVSNTIPAIEAFLTGMIDQISKLNPVTGLYDAVAGFDNLGTSLLKFLTPTGGNIGKFDADGLLGTINSAVQIGSTAISSIFNGTGQFIGALTTSATYSGVALSTFFQNINSAGQHLASGLTGGMNTAVTIGGQAISSIFNGSGHFIGQISSSATGALNGAITFGGTALSTLLQYLNSSGLFDAARLTGTLASTILTQIADALIALIPNRYGSLPSGLTGLSNLFSDLVTNAGITANLGSGTPTVAALGSVPGLAPVIPTIQAVADAIGVATQGPAAFVQQAVTNATALQVALQSQIQASLAAFVVPHFW